MLYSNVIFKCYIQILYSNFIFKFYSKNMNINIKSIKNTNDII